MNPLESHSNPAPSELELAVIAFDQLNQRMATIAQAAQSAPEEDKPHHQAALLNSYAKSREYLEGQPTLQDHYRAVGSFALSHTVESFGTALTSAEQLLGYVREGLLDSLTIEQLEDRVRIITAAQQVSEHLPDLDSLFGDILTPSMVVDDQEVPVIEEAAVEISEQPPHIDELEDIASDESAEAPEPQTLVADDLPVEAVSEVEENEVMAEADEEAAQETTQTPIELAAVMIALKDTITSQARLAVIKNALNAAVRLEEVRKNDPKVRAISDGAYEDLKSDFKGLMQLAVTALHKHGLTAEWVVTGKARGTRYRLVVKDLVIPETTATLPAKPKRVVKAKPPVEVPEIKTDPVLPPVVKTEDRASNRIEQRLEASQQQKAAAFVIDLVTSIDEIMDDRQVFKTKQNHIIREVAKWLDIELDEATTLIKDLIKAEILFVTGADKGYDILSLDRPETPFVRSRVKRSKEKAETDTFTVSDLALADKVFAAVVEAGHQSKGVTVQAAASQLGMDDVEARRFINRLVKAGALTNDQGWVRSGSPRSRKKTASILKFPSQSSWNRYKSSPQDYLSGLGVTPVDLDKTS